MSKEREQNIEDDDDKEVVTNGAEESNLDVKDDGNGVVVTERKQSRREEREAKHAAQRGREIDEKLSPILQALKAIQEGQQRSQRQPIFQPRQEQEAPKTTDERTFDKVYDEMVDIQTELQSGGKTDSEARKLSARYRELSKESIRLEAQIAAKEVMGRQPRQQQQEPQTDPQTQYEVVELTRHNPLVMKDREAIATAQGLFWAMKKRGEITPENSLEKQKECIDRAAAEFGYNVRTPSASEKARFGSSSASNAGRGGRGEVRLSERSIDMATSANPHLARDKAIQKWVGEQLAAGNTLADLQ